MDPTLDLNLIRLFVSIVQAGTLSEAAIRNGVTRSLVSRKLKSLEAAVGAQLLRRTTRHIELTQQGQALYEHGMRIEWELEAAQQRVRLLNDKPKGYLRISLPTGISSIILRPLLIQFANDYPQLSLRVLLSNRVSDLLRSEIDIALRVMTTPPDNYVARKILDVTWGLYAAPSYIAKKSSALHPSDLSTMDYLCPPIEGPYATVSFHDQNQNLTSIQLRPKLQSEDYSFLKEAAVLGAGIAILPSYMVRRSDVRDQLLQEVLPSYSVQGLGDTLFILTSPNLYPSSAVKIAIDFLTKSVSQLENN